MFFDAQATQRLKEDMVSHALTLFNIVSQQCLCHPRLLLGAPRSRTVNITNMLGQRHTLLQERKYVE